MLLPPLASYSSPQPTSTKFSVKYADDAGEGNPSKDDAFLPLYFFLLVSFFCTE